MSAVMTGPSLGTIAPLPGPAGGTGRGPGGLPDYPLERSQVTDQPDDGPDTEELDLAALLVAGARSPAVPPEPRSTTRRPTAVAPAQQPRSREVSDRWPDARDYVPALRPGLIGRGSLSGTPGELGRLGLHLLLAALPLLAISAQVFGLVDMNVSAGLLVLPLTAVMVAVSLLRPLSSDRVVVAGMAWGLLATVVYDGFRLDTVYLMGWWGDFIPRMGTWLINTDPSNLAAGAVAGYVWRYLGDGGGIGVAFFVLAAATGLRSRGPQVTVATAIGFAVFPVWSGLIATVALSPRGQSMMFALTPTTIILSLIGHLIFGAVLGLGAVRCEAIDTAWPWPPLLELLGRQTGTGAQVPWAPIAVTATRLDRPRGAPQEMLGARRACARTSSATGPPSGPLATASPRAPRSGPLPVSRGSGPELGPLEVPSWPGAAVRVVRGWPSSPQPPQVRTAAMSGRVPR